MAAPLRVSRSGGVPTTTATRPGARPTVDSLGDRIDFDGTCTVCGGRLGVNADDQLDNHDRADRHPVCRDGAAWAPASCPCPGSGAVAADVKRRPFWPCEGLRWVS